MESLLKSFKVGVHLHQIIYVHQSAYLQHNCTTSTDKAVISSGKFIVQTIRKMYKKLRVQNMVRIQTPTPQRNYGLPVSAIVKAHELMWETDYSLEVIQLQLLSSALGFKSPLPCGVW